MSKSIKIDDIDMYHSRLALGHVDSTVQELDLLGILVERCSVQQQMGKIMREKKESIFKKKLQ